jgi:hypothetical protein
VEDVPPPQLTLRYEVVLLVAFGAMIWVLGQWVIEQAGPFGGFWMGSAPLTNSPDYGLHPWVQAVLWMFLIAVWTIVALWLLRETKPNTQAAKDGESVDGAK